MALFKKDKLGDIREQKTRQEQARTYHILLVDDEPDNLRVLQDLLQEQYHIHVADSGSKGLEIIRAQPMDLIISDQRMPGMTGVEFLSQTLPSYPYCIRLILTGYTDIDAIIAAVNQGRVYRYLTKPWDTRELLMTIQRALEAYESERRSRRKSEFLASTSHELRTPLNAIIGYSEMLREQAEELGQPAMISDLDRITSAGRHLLGLINEILDFSKIEAGKMELFVEAFDLGALVKDVLAVAAPLVKKNGNGLETVVPDGLGTAQTDQMKLRQCLFNLISNAAKFTKGGTITLRATRVAREGREFLEFAVSDTGIGMNPEQLGRLFQAYAQAEQATQAKYGGTGLGLVLCKQFCQLMQGDVTVESTPGQGTTFTIRVPAQLPLPKKPDSPAPLV